MAVDADERQVGNPQAADHAGGQYATILKLGVLAVVIGAAYSLGYWRNGPSAQELPAEAPQPEFLAFEPAAIDLGDQFWGRDIPFELRLVNATNRSVAIKDVSASCDCTPMDQQAYLGRVIGPGESLVLAGTVDVGLRLGAKTSDILVRTTEGDRCETTVLLNVAPTFTVTPVTLDFALVEPGQALTRTVAFRSPRVHLVAPPAPDSEWITAETTECDGGTDIRVTLLPQRMQPGSNLGRIALLTDDVYVNSYALAVRAVVRSD